SQLLSALDDAVAVGVAHGDHRRGSVVAHAGIADRRAGPGQGRLAVHQEIDLGLDHTGDPDVVHLTAAVVELVAPLSAVLLVRLVGGVELPGFGDPADSHPLAEIARQIEFRLHPVAGPDVPGHARALALTGGRLVPLPAAVGPHALRPAHRFVGSAG